jgi:hypothetical protein
MTSVQVITEDLFPMMYQYQPSTSDVIIDDKLAALYPDVYLEYGLPATLTPSIDPRYVTGPQKYEYKYSNSNGVEVTLRGTYNSVMSTVDVLKAYPPLLKDFKKIEEGSGNCCEGRELFDVFGEGSLARKKSATESSVPGVGIETKGEYVAIKLPNGKIYTESGVLIFVVGNTSQSNPLDSAKLVLFKNTNEDYAEFGGKIKQKLLVPGKETTEEILFTNAKNEIMEKSSNLLIVNNPSPIFIDIELTDNTYYRVFVYVFAMNNASVLSEHYNYDRSTVLQNIFGYQQFYPEGGKLKLFDYKQIINKLNMFASTPVIYNRTSFVDNEGNSKWVSGRTLKLITQLKDNSNFKDIMDKKQLQTVKYEDKQPIFKQYTISA